jgi:hypothetical protein
MRPVNDRCKMAVRTQLADEIRQCPNLRWTKHGRNGVPDSSNAKAPPGSSAHINTFSTAFSTTLVCSGLQPTGSTGYR